MRLAQGRFTALLFWGVVVLYVGYANSVFALLLAAPIPTADTYGYLEWWLFRTIGYAALLWVYDALFPTWTAFPAVQLNLLLAGVVALAWGVARLTRSYLAAAAVLVLVAAAANMMLSAAYLMTEAAFSAAIMLHLGAMYALLARAGRLPAALAGLALAAAILVKSVATVLVGPLTLFLAFAAPPMRRLLVLVLLPALVAWAAPSAYNLARFGAFESSIAGGYALSGHVAWAIKPHPDSPHAQVAARIEARLKPVLAQRPDWKGSRQEYMTYTSNEYNTLLWGNIVPEVANYLGPQHCGGQYYLTCKWSGCPAQCMIHTNRILLALSREAIAAQPRDYAYHVFAHTYGMWTHVFTSSRDFVQGVNARADELPVAYSPSTTIARPLLEPVPEFTPPEARLALAQQIESSWAARLVDWLTVRRPAYWLVGVLDRYAGVLPWIGLLASALVFGLRKLSPAAAAFCYTGLVINAYFLGTALAQPVLSRYTWPVQGVLAALLALGAWLAATQALARLRRQRGPPVELRP